ncbi:hypothetical protein BDR07DRAFT_152153 [Suillus spraguei]|nr:hypothetical protein BDR07DRAFT_152153 [Suillus spraguei]
MAGSYITWPTGYEALVGRAGLKPGESILSNGAAGGVGIVAVQLAKALGATVIAAAGSQSKLDICKIYGGADYTVNYTEKDWQKQVLRIMSGKGVDVVYDPVGRIAESLKCIAFKGRALVIGFATGEIEKLPLNIVLLKNVSVMGHTGACIPPRNHLAFSWYRRNCWGYSLLVALNLQYVTRSSP